MDRTIRTVEDVLLLLDRFFTSDSGDGRLTTGDGDDFWDRFYADRSRQVPFFVTKPDENLAACLDLGLIAPGRALDLGCGPGRNALYLASHGFEVDAVDLSPVAIAWARERAQEARADIGFRCGDAFALSAAAPSATDLGGQYDLIVDSGCFHHLALLDRLLAPGGHLALTCFAAGEMGSELPDDELYRERELGGGLAYTPESLRWIFSDLTEIDLRRMQDEPPESAYFGEPFLWTALFRRDAA
jgi:SAM-dependent methyltransferase